MKVILKKTYLLTGGLPLRQESHPAVPGGQVAPPQAQTHEMTYSQARMLLELQTCSRMRGILWKVWGASTLTSHHSTNEKAREGSSQGSQWSSSGGVDFQEKQLVTRQNKRRPKGTNTLVPALHFLSSFSSPSSTHHPKRLSDQIRKKSASTPTRPQK